MKKFNLMIAGFNLAVGIFNLLTGQYVVAGIVLFSAVVSYELSKCYE